MTNQEILKANIDTALGGLQSEIHLGNFLELTKDTSSAFLQRIQRKTVASGIAKIDTLGIESRLLRPYTEGTAYTSAVAATIAQRTLTMKGVILPFNVTYDWLAENIMGAAGANIIYDMFSKQFTNDLLDLAINGNESLAATITDTTPANGLDDTTGLTQNDHTFLRQNNGWIKLALADSTVNDVSISHTNSVVADWRAELNKMLKAMPYKWLAASELVFMMNPADYQDYYDKVATTATDSSIALLTGGGGIRYKGIEIVPLRQMPALNVMLTSPQNLVIGLSREITWEQQRNPRAGMIEYTGSAKLDFEYAIGEAIVLGQKA